MVARLRCAISAMLMVATLAGCTQMVWVKPGATDADIQIAKGRCQVHAYGQVPVAPASTIVGGGYVSPMVTTCSGAGHAATCVTSGGFYTPPSVVNYDANRGIRNEVFAACMQADGWSLQEAGKAAEVTETDWTKGFNFGLGNRARGLCDTAPAGVVNTSDWMLGCRSGQKNR